MINRWLAIIATQSSSILLGLVSVRVMSYLVLPAVYGEYTAFLTLTQLSILLTHSDLMNHASRYWQREQANGAYPAFLWKVCFKKSLPLALLLCLAGGTLYAVTRNVLWLEMLPFLFIANLALASFTLCQLILNASERFWRIFSANFAANLGRVFLPALAVVLFSPSAAILGAAFSCQQLLAAVLIYALTAKAFIASGSGSSTVATKAVWEEQLVKFGRPFIILGIGGWLLQFADRWIVLMIFGKEAAGEFGLAGQISAIIPTFAASAFLQFVFPKFFREADQAKEREDWHRLAKTADQNTVLLFAGTTLGLIALVLAIPFLRDIILSRRYAIPPLVFLGTGFAALAGQANQLQYLLLQGKQDSSGMVKVMIVVAGVKTFISLAFVCVSYESYLYWLIASPFLAVVIGRFMIRRIVFSQ